MHNDGFVGDYVVPENQLVPASRYVYGMPGSVVLRQEELVIPPDILGRKLTEVCNPALDNCSFNTSEDDYWSVHE